MPISAVDAISPAFQHTTRQLTKPFRLGQWWRLALVGLLAGELSSGGGCNFHVPSFPRQTGGSNHFLAAAPFSSADPMLFAALIGIVVVLGLILGVFLIYVNSVMRFVLFDSVVAKECRIRQGWSRRTGAGFRYFVWQISLMAVMIAGLVILVGIPAAIAFGLGWLKAPGDHVLPLVLGGVLLFFLFFAFIVLSLVVQVMTKDFVVPQMALEDISALEGWRRLWHMSAGEKGSYAGYIGMKVVMAIGAAVLVGMWWASRLCSFSSP